MLLFMFVVVGVQDNFNIFPRAFHGTKTPSLYSSMMILLFLLLTGVPVRCVHPVWLDPAARLSSYFEEAVEASGLLELHEKEQLGDESAADRWASAQKLARDIVGLFPKLDATPPSGGSQPRRRSLLADVGDGIGANDEPPGTTAKDTPVGGDTPPGTEGYDPQSALAEPSTECFHKLNEYRWKCLFGSPKGTYYQGKHWQEK